MHVGFVAMNKNESLKNSITFKSKRKKFNTVIKAGFCLFTYHTIWELNSIRKHDKHFLKQQISRKGMSEIIFSGRLKEVVLYVWPIDAMSRTVTLLLLLLRLMTALTFPHEYHFFKFPAFWSKQSNHNSIRNQQSKLHFTAIWLMPFHMLHEMLIT